MTLPSAVAGATGIPPHPRSRLRARLVLAGFAALVLAVLMSALTSLGMAAAFSAGGVKARVDAHLDAGCDVVLVCHPELVAESLAAVEGRSLNTMALTGLIGRGPLGWDAALAGGASAARTGDTA